MRSAAAASRCRASSSAAATSAVSVPRTAHFGAGETEGRGARDHGRGLGGRDHDVRHRGRVRRRPQRVVHRQLAPHQGPGRARPDRADDEDVQPDERRRRPWARRASGSCARSTAASSASASSRSRSTSPTTWIRPSRWRRRSAPSTLSSPKGRSAPTAAATSTSRGSRRRSASGRPDWVQNSYSLLDRERRAGRARRVRARRARLHAVQPARRRLAHRQVQARRGAAGGLADDAAARAVPPPAGGPRLRRARGARGEGRASAGRLPPRSRSPGCSHTRT